MIIKELYVENFGKLSSFKYSFSSGLNSIIRNNGFGKTTLAAFIKAMFYGLEDNRRQSLLENDRKRYTPWQSGAFGGWLIYESDGQEYRIERSFGAKASQDSFNLTNIKTGEALPLPEESLGKMLFDIDADGFEKTVFLSEKSIYTGGVPDSVASKLAGITGIEGDIGGFDDAIELLDKQRKLYFKKGGSGLIRDTEEEIFTLKEKLRHIEEVRSLCRNYESSTENAARSISELTEKKNRLLEEKKQYDELNARAAFYREYQSHCERLTAEEAREEKILEFFKNGLTDNSEIAEVERKASIAAEIRKIATEKADAFAVEKAECPFVRIPTEEEIASHSLAFSTGKDGKSKRNNALLFVLIAAAVASAALGFINPLLLIPCGVLTIAAIAYGILSTKSSKSSGAIENAINFIIEIYGEPPTCEPLTALITMRAELEKYNQQTERIEAEYQRNAKLQAEEIKHSEELLRSAEEFLSRFPTVSEKPFEEIRQKLFEYSLIGASLKRLREECDIFAKQHGIKEAELKSADGQRLREITEEISAIEAEISRISKDKLLAESAHRSAITETNESVVIEAQLNEAQENCEAYRNKLSVITKTQELLTRAKANMTARYLDKTKTKFDEYVSYIDDFDGEFTIDTSFAIKRIDMGATRACEAYSRGTRELYLLALRLALISSLYEKEQPPIVLDDPFIAFDDGNIKRGMKLLEKISRSGQIIYFACSKARE